MQSYLLLCLSILFASANNLLLHKFGNRGLDSPGGVLLFNAAVSGIWVILLGETSMISGGLRSDTGSVCWGMLYGVVTAAFLFIKMQAMATGPVSLTAFIGCASLLISTGFGVFVLGEGASVLQTVGVAILMIALFLIVSPKNDHAKKSWKLWCAGFFTCSAAVGIIFKLHQRSGSASKINEMMFATALTSALLFTAMSFAVSEKHRPKRLPGRLRNRRLRLQPAEHLPRGAIAERRILPDLQRLGDTHFDTVRTDFLQRKTESAAGNRHCRRSGGADARVGDDRQSFENHLGG